MLKSIKIFICFFISMMILAFVPVLAGIGFTKLAHAFLGGEGWESLGVVIGFIVFISLVGTYMELDILKHKEDK